VAPLYNEEETLPYFYARVVAVMERLDEPIAPTERAASPRRRLDYWAGCIGPSLAFLSENRGERCSG
jgi:hypothetical protein